MAHQDAGHYAGKHPDKTIDPDIAGMLQERADQGAITCAAVHSVAGKLSIPPAEAGIQADLLELRLTRCQLGLFGYPPEGKRLNPDFKVPENLAEALKSAAKDGRIPCKVCWETAESLGVSRPDAGSACEKLGLKIKPCQIGAF